MAPSSHHYLGMHESVCESSARPKFDLFLRDTFCEPWRLQGSPNARN